METICVLVRKDIKEMVPTVMISTNVQRTMVDVTKMQIAQTLTDLTVALAMTDTKEMDTIALISMNAKAVNQLVITLLCVSIPTALITASRQHNALLDRLETQAISVRN
jgi:hypothetical protein